MKIGQPLWRTRQQIERDHIVFAQLADQQILGFQLVIGVGEARLDAVAVQRDHFRVEAGRLQNTFHALQQCGIRLQAGAQRRYLHGGRFAVKIRQGVNQPGQQHGQNQQIFPQWITVH